MERITNPIRDVFASIRFAVLILSLLAVTSIIGTVIPQGEPVAFYIDKYGQQLAILIKIFDLDCTYSSIWFGFLLFLLTLSLSDCIFQRLPRVRDNLTANIAKFLRYLKKTVSTSGIIDLKGAEANNRNQSEKI